MVSFIDMHGFYYEFPATAICLLMFNIVSELTKPPLLHCGVVLFLLIYFSDNVRIKGKESFFLSSLLSNVLSF